MNSTVENFNIGAREPCYSRWKIYPTNTDWLPPLPPSQQPQGTHSHQFLPSALRGVQAALQRPPQELGCAPGLPSLSCFLCPSPSATGPWNVLWPSASVQLLTANYQPPVNNCQLPAPCLPTTVNLSGLPGSQGLISPPGHTGQDAASQQQPRKTPASAGAPQKSPTHPKQGAATICGQSNCPSHGPGESRRPFCEVEVTAGLDSRPCPESPSLGHTTQCNSSHPSYCMPTHFEMKKRLNQAFIEILFFTA
ncbi:uncharacterized protein LOC110399324 [Numida meleagris]|uniref:uncharacterized protein LOC110399324 n=1 Tax=Numida meleagris TaxID=8996 RepID=UPI000B3DA2A0|nr:uncharacterized protein LOC110399324 [Numida meleagris]